MLEETEETVGYAFLSHFHHWWHFTSGWGEALGPPWLRLYHKYTLSQVTQYRRVCTNFVQTTISRKVFSHKNQQRKLEHKNHAVPVLSWLKHFVFALNLFTDTNQIFRKSLVSLTFLTIRTSK